MTATDPRPGEWGDGGRKSSGEPGEPSRFANDRTGAFGWNRPRICYLRVPKTGSISVVQTIRAALGCSRNAELHLADILAGPAAAAVDPARAPFAHGHVTWCDAEWLLADPAEWTAAVTLRDPVERTVSHYRYLRRRAITGDVPETNVGLYREVLERPLGELIHDRDSLFHRWTMPAQTIFLGADRAGLYRLGDAPWSDEVIGHATAPEVLARALDRLEGLGWVGILDTLHRDLGTLAAAREWPDPAPVHANRTPRDVDFSGFDRLDDADRRTLADRLAPDYVLLESARELVAERREQGARRRLARPCTWPSPV